MEADRRHTTTGCESRKSCFQTGLDLAKLVVDGNPEALERPGRYVNVLRPCRTRYGRFDSSSQIARGAQRAPRHDELCDPASPTLFAVLTQDSLDLRSRVAVDDLRRGERRAWVHPHVEGAVGTEAEPTFRVIDLTAGEAEVEQDQVGGGESVLGADRLQLGESTVGNDCRRPKSGQGFSDGLHGCGIAVDPEQPAVRNDPLKNLAGVARLPQGAVDRDRPPLGLEQLYYLL